MLLDNVVMLGYDRGMTSTPHTNCSHSATKADRAKCRKDRAAAHLRNISTLEAILNSYYDDSTDLETIIGEISRLAATTSNTDLLDSVNGYYDSSLDAEE